jgi:hypothetical protein
VHYIVKDAKKKAEDNNRKLLDQRNFEDASLKIDDIVDFRVSIRGREVTGAVYLVSEEGGE